ncbi:armadillo repeat-containing protein 3-like [Colletes latitarsis]|uniref:armadillo repeat-containing protein 3-like n=1 Tax=Colletes latitarsis TaxID=2605962 RepID=UPI0040364A0D
MGPKKKRSAKDKGRVDREEQTKYKFDPLALEIKYPGTAILLLQCQEQPILLAAAAALSKYGSKSQGNLEILFDLEIVSNVIPLIDHDDLFTRRFAAKLLAEMVFIPNVCNFLLDSNHYIPHFVRVLINDQDVFMQEFSSGILAEASRNMFGAAQLLKQCPDMNFLFERLQSPDPDVKKNNLEIAYNLLQDSTGAKAITGAKNFSFNPLYDLFDSPYRQIQSLALNVVGDLVSRNRDDRLQELFRRSNGLQALLKFLDNEECVDLHSEALRILRLASDNPATIELLDNIGGIKRLLKYIEETPNSKFFMEALAVAVRLSHTPLGRKALHTYGIVDHLLTTLAGNMHPDIYEIGCHGIGMMTLHNEAAKELTASGCVKNILDILKNENLKWTARQAAMFALNQLLKCDIENCHDFLNIHGQVDKCLRHPRSFERLYDPPLNTEYFVDLLELSYMADETNHGKVPNPARPKTSICDLIVTDNRRKRCFSMIKNRSTARAIPSWDTCIEALFDSHLPIKFAFTGRLSLHDITQNGFYVLRRNVCPFPILDDIFRFKFCPLEPIYVVNIVRDHQSGSQESSLNRSVSEESALANVEDLNRGGRFLSGTIETLIMNSKYDRLQCDTCLYDYVELFKCKLLAAESKSVTETKPGLANVSFVASRAKMLAKFVARQMSGPDPVIGCVDHQLEIHLKEVKDSIETSVIPLGLLRVGSYLERALLFKVIADRVHLPAALVRGEYGKAWIEIAVPQVKFSVHDCETVFPTKLMKPNFIVDLMDSPGNLIPIGCRRAKMYYETLQPICEKVCP